MIATPKLLRVVTLMMAATLLACTNDIANPVMPDPVTPEPGTPSRIFTSLQIESPATMVPITTLHVSRIEIRARDQNGVPMVVERGSFTISSSNPSVVTIGEQQFWTAESNGKPDDSWIAAFVTALAPGEAEIAVSWSTGGVTKTAKSTIKVESTEGWSLRVEPATLVLKLGSRERLRAFVLDATGKTRAQYAAFTSDHDDVVSVFEDEACLDWWPCDGINVRGLALGEATVSARLDGLSAKVAVTVVPST